MPLALRSPPFLPQNLTALLFENHYGTWIAILILGAILILLARSRANRKLLRIGQIALALTLLWLIAARLITTPAERLYNAHIALADAVSKADVDRLLSYFAPNFIAKAGPVQIFDSTSSAQAKDLIADALKTYGIRETYIRSYSYGTLSNSDATTYFTALTAGDYPLLTTWHVTWEDAPAQDWRISQATLLKLGDQLISPDTFNNSPTPHLP